MIICSRGPSSDCGASGQAVVRGRTGSECEVEFQFRSSLLSNNGTDVDVGQIPELYYQLENAEAANGNGARKSTPAATEPPGDVTERFVLEVSE